MTNVYFFTRYAAAELDCTRALTLDPGYVKALHRRGQARAALKKYTEAKDDFTEVLKKEPKNKQAKSELDKVEKVLTSYGSIACNFLLKICCIINRANIYDS